MKSETPDGKTKHSSPPNEGTYVKGDVNTGGGHFIGRDKIINIGTIKIPIYLAVIIVVCMLGVFAIIAYPSVRQLLPKPLAFPAATSDETLILIATFHNTAATNAEAHKKISRAIATEVVKQGEQKLRVEVEPTELMADQRSQAEMLGKRYNASMVIWGEDTGVEVIVNFLNLKEPDFDAARVTITEKERTQLANPSAYVRFVTDDLPQQMTFFALFTVGQLYYQRGNSSIAIKRIEAAIDLLSPKNSPEGLDDAYFQLGWLYQTSSVINLSKTIANYSKAIELNPQTVSAYINRGTAYSDLGDMPSAFADYTKAIELDPNPALAYNNQGTAYAKQTDLKAALADFNKAIELDPNYASAYLERGTAYSDQGDMQAALADYTKAIKLDPNFAIAYSNRGNAYAKQGDVQAALADFNKAIELDPNFAPAYSNRGIFYAKQGDMQAAIINFRYYLQLEPTAVDRFQVEQAITDLEAELAKQK